MKKENYSCPKVEVMDLRTMNATMDGGQITGGGTVLPGFGNGAPKGGTFIYE